MAITFGSSSAPSQITTNLDAVFATSLANYKKTLTDNISRANAFFYEIKKGGTWEGQEGGAYIAEDLMYELGQFDSYDGYDELPDTPTDGITQVQFEWRQGAVPVSYNQKEVKQNKQRLVNLVKSKIKQAEMGWIEGFNKALLQGSLSQTSSGSLLTPFTSTFNGSLFIDPLPKIVAYDPTTSMSVGNLNQSTYTWWRNRTKTCTATDYTTFLAQLDNLYNNCSKGPGGAPDLILCDQTTYELLNQAYYFKYRNTAAEDANYPFQSIKFRNARVVWDEFVPNVSAGTTDTTTAAGGTAYMLNTKFFSMKYESGTEFEMTDFAKPIKGDSRLAHILFMGQLTVNNRRKHGVMGAIPRTLTAA